MEVLIKMFLKVVLVPWALDLLDKVTAKLNGKLKSFMED